MPRRDLGFESDRTARIFISYSRKDMQFADKLDEALKGRGFETLIDREEIYAFEDWWKRIEELIARADTVVFVLSPDSVSSDVALNEVIKAASLNKRFAPIVYRRVNDDAIPEALRRLNFIFFDEPTEFEASANRLAEALKTDIAWIWRHTELSEASRQWMAAGCANGLLLRSPLLEEAERWINSRPHGAPKPTAEVSAFVVGSRRSATRRKHLAFAYAMAFLFVAIGGLSYLAWSNQFYLRVHASELIDTLWPKVMTPDAEQKLTPGQTFAECSVCPQMTVIPLAVSQCLECEFLAINVELALDAAGAQLYEDRALDLPPMIGISMFLPSNFDSTKDPLWVALKNAKLYPLVIYRRLPDALPIKTNIRVIFIGEKGVPPESAAYFPPGARYNWTVLPLGRDVPSP